MNIGGQPIARVPLRVDSIHPGLGYVYFSDIDRTDAQGAFEFFVYRSHRIQEPTDPDTVTMAIKAYDTQTPGPADQPIGLAEIRMTFRPTGEPWVVTEGQVAFSELGG